MTDKVRTIVSTFLDKPEEDRWYIRYLQFQILLATREFNISDDEKAIVLEILYMLLPENARSESSKNQVATYDYFRAKMLNAVIDSHGKASQSSKDILKTYFKSLGLVTVDK